MSIPPRVEAPARLEPRSGGRLKPTMGAVGAGACARAPEGRPYPDRSPLRGSDGFPYPPTAPAVG